MAAIVQNDIYAPHFLHNIVQKILVVLRPNPNLSGDSIKSRTFRVHINSENYRVIPQIFSPQL